MNCWFCYRSEWCGFRTGIEKLIRDLNASEYLGYVIVFIRRKHRRMSPSDDDAMNEGGQLLISGTMTRQTNLHVRRLLKMAAVMALTGPSVHAFAPPKTNHHPQVCSANLIATSSSTRLMSNSYTAPFEQVGRVMMDQSDLAIEFFDSIRVPAALIAGSALATIFTNASPIQQQSKNPKSWFNRIKQNQSPLANRVLVFYHLAALLAFLLSLNVELTSTATSNALLLGLRDPMARSPYQLLRRELDFEFTTTKWSFYMSLFAFLAAVTGHCLIEFSLLTPERIRSAIMLILANTSLAFNLLSIANKNLGSWPNMLSMTGYVLQQYWKRAIHNPAQMVSLVCGLGSATLACIVARRTQGFANLFQEEDPDDDEDEGKSSSPGSSSKMKFSSSAP